VRMAMHPMGFAYVNGSCTNWSATPCYSTSGSMPHHTSVHGSIGLVVVTGVHFHSNLPTTHCVATFDDC
jgi:hypothetical protein